MIRTKKGQSTYNELATMCCNIMTLRRSIERGLNKIYEDAERGERWLTSGEQKATIKGECIIGMLRQFEEQCETMRCEVARNSQTIDLLIERGESEQEH